MNKSILSAVALLGASVVFSAFGDGAAVYDSTSYKQEGLVLQLDALENAGRGVFDATATEWKELTGVRSDATFSGDCSWSPVGLVVNGKSGRAYVTFDGRLTKAHTIEVVAKVSDTESYGRITAESTFPSLDITSGNANLRAAKIGLYGYSKDLASLANATFNAMEIVTYAYGQSGVLADGAFFYLSGALYANSAIGATSTGATAYLGNRPSLGRGIDAIYYAVRIYDHVLTPEEIAAHAKIDAARFDPTVKRTIAVDSVKGDDANDGVITLSPDRRTAVTNAVKTISRALDLAADGYTIALAPGDYVSQTITNTKKCVTFRGADRATTILDGEGLRRILFCSTASYSNRFENLTFQNGHRPAAQSAGASAYSDVYGGGAICLAYSSLYPSVISNCLFRGNATDYFTPTAGQGGGAVFCNAALEVYDSVFSNNVAAATGGGGGGAVFVDGTSETPTVFERCLFEANVATNQGSGGAVMFRASTCSPNLMRDCVFARNGTVRGDPRLTGNANDKSNPRGAGGAVHGIFELVENCTFVSNSTVSVLSPATNNAHVGALWIASRGSNEKPVSVWNCRFVGNRAEGAIGAIGIGSVSASTDPKVPRSPVSISNCVFDANSSVCECAVFGGAYGSMGFNTLTIEDCSFTGNRVTGGNRADTRGVYTYDSTMAMLSIYAMTSCVRRCVIRGNFSPSTCSGISLFNRGNNGSWYGKSWVEDCVFEGNVCGFEDAPLTTANNGSGALYVNNVSSNTVVRNCLFVRNETKRRLGGALWAEKMEGQNAHRDNVMTVENCTFVDNLAFQRDNNSYCLGTPYVYRSLPESLDCVIRNCIMSGNGGTNSAGAFEVRSVSSDVKVSSTNNLYSSAGTSTAFNFSDGDKGCIVGRDPQFVDAAHGDCRIRRISPARDCGIEFPWMREPGAHDLLVTNEFGKVSSRIYGPTVDLGCYEWRPTTGLLLFLR